MIGKLFLAATLTLMSLTSFATNAQKDREIKINVINKVNDELNLYISDEAGNIKNIDINAHDEVNISYRFSNSFPFEYKLVSDQPTTHILQIMSDMLSSVHIANREYNLTIAANANPKDIYSSDVSCEMREKYDDQQWLEWKECQLF